MKNRELELQGLCKDLGVEKLRISPNPSENVTTEDCINHVIEILSDFKHESEKGIIGTENSIFYELKQFNTF